MTGKRRYIYIALVAAMLAMLLPQAVLGITLPGAVPAAHDDAYTTASDAGAPPLHASAPGVLANDDGASLTAAKVGDPSHGTVTLNADGSFTYTPTLNFVGTDYFTYKANNGHADSAPATVAVTVAHGNLPPALTVPGAQNAVQGIALTFSTGNTNAVIVTDPDAGTSPLVVTLGASHGMITVGTAGVTVAGNGTASVQVTGPQAAITSALNGMTYTASAAYTGPDVLTVHADDQGNTGAGGAKTADASVTITVTSVPGVASTTPANNATAVLASATIGITFSKAVNVTANAFTLACSTGAPPVFTVSPASPATTFTLTPSAALPAGALCTVTVVASQVSDAGNGSHPTADYSFSFTVDTPPVVSSTAPANGATGIGTGKTVSITFSAPVNVTATAFTLECPAGNAQAFTVTPASPATTYVLHPTSSLPAGAFCTVTAVASQIADAAGTHLGSDYTFTFTVDTAPVVQSTTPTTGATNVALNSAITATFDRAVNVTATAFTLECPAGNAQAFTVTPASPATSYTLTPSANLPAGVTCTLTVMAAQVMDGAGTHPASDVIVTFTTDTAPVVTTTTPTGGATNVAPTTTVTVNFSKPVNATTASFTLECPVGTAETFTLTPGSPSSSYVLHPSATLPVSTTCTVTVLAVQVTDTAGTHMAADAVFTFTIGTPPTVTGTTPSTGATSVATTSTVTLTFNTSVATTGTAFKLECPTGTPVAFSVTPASPATSYVLHPTSGLPQGVPCTVTAAASQITDSTTGINLAGDYVFTFATNTLPTVSSTVPTNNATTILPSTTITVNFSEPVNVTGSAFTLECPVGTSKGFAVTPASPASSYVLHPTANLPGGMTCTVTVVANQVTDVDASQNMAANDVFSFAVDAPPSVSGTTPANGATTVATTSTVTVTFSEQVNVTGTAFALACPTGMPVTVNVTPASPATSFVLHPSANLPGGAICTLTVAANQVTDVDAGQNMASDFSASFTVDVPPTVTSTSPANNATSVATTSTIQVTFNETVTATTSSFALECPTGTAKTFSVSGSGTNVITLTPSASLPADTVCTVTVVAANVTDAVGSPMVSNTPFSFAVQPVAVNDSFPETVVGGIAVNSANVSGGAFSVTGNDSFTTATITAFDAASAHGGTVTMTQSGGTIGQFIYTPPGNYTGSDSFAYTLSDANGSSTATVTLTISNRVAVTSTTGSGNACTVAAPCTLATADGFAVPGSGKDLVYVESGTYSGVGFSLNSSQYLIGQGIDLSTAITRAGITLPASAVTTGFPSASTKPVLGSTVTLANSAQVHALDISAGANTGLSGSGVTSVTVGNASGTGNDNVTVTTSTGTGMSVSSATGAFTIAGLTTSGGAGANLTNNTGATFTFSALSVSAGANNGFVATGGGTVTVTGSTNTLTTTTGTALNVANTTIGASGLTFKSIAASGGTNGIVLNATGTSGGLTVTGDGATDPADLTRGTIAAKAGTGGTIQNTGGSGIILTNTKSVSLTSMKILNAGGATVNSGNNGITATAVNGLTLDDVLISGSTGNSGIRGISTGGTASITNLSMQHVDIDSNGTAVGTETNDNWNVRIDDLAGNCGDATNGCGWNNSLFFNSRENIVGLQQGISATSVSLTMTITNSEFRDTTALASPGNDAFSLSAHNSAVTTITATGSTFRNVEVAGFQYSGNDNSSGTVNVRSSMFETTGSDVLISHNGGAPTIATMLNFDVSKNTERQATGNPNSSNAINVFLAGNSNSGSKMVGTIKTNIIGNVGISGSGSHVGQGISLNATGAGTMTATVTGNMVHQTFQDTPFFAEANSGTARLNVYLHSNTFNSDSSGTGLAGTQLVGGAQPSDASTLYVDMGANTIHGDPTYAGIEVDSLGGASSSVQLVGLNTTFNNNTTAIGNFVGDSAATTPPGVNTSVTPAPPNQSLITISGGGSIVGTTATVTFPP